MGKRYYYDCPLQAAWMNRVHGVLLHADKYEKNDYWRGVNFWIEPSSVTMYFVDEHGDVVENQKRFYVLPQSLPLLEPQAGDLIHYKNFHKNAADNYNVIVHIDDTYIRFSNSDCRRDINRVRIIERQGKAFFTTLVEEQP